MLIEPFQPLNFQTHSLPTPSSPKTTFNEYLSKTTTPVTDMGPDGPDVDPTEDARQAARSLVAVGLVHPVLKKLRESNQAWGPFAPNSAERSFGAVMDQRLADHIVHARNWPLVEQITQSLLRNKGLSASGPAANEGVQA